MNIIKYWGLGASHEQKGKECQDYCDFFVPAENEAVQNTILALSDGCSSSDFALEAAKANVNAIIRLFQRIPLEKFLTLNKATQREVLQKACLFEIDKITEAVSYAQCCATLAFVIMDKENLLIGHVGDGAVYCMGHEEEFIYTSDPENGEKLNQTHFTVEQNPVIFHLIVLERRDVGNILLCSDGPCRLFKKYGTLRNSRAVQQLSAWVSEGKTRNCTDLREDLNYMTSDMIEHGDDWSVLLLAPHQEQCGDLPKEPISMRLDVIKKFSPEQFEQIIAEQRQKQAKATRENRAQETVAEHSAPKKVPPISERSAQTEHAAQTTEVLQTNHANENDEADCLLPADAGSEEATPLCAQVKAPVQIAVKPAKKATAKEEKKEGFLTSLRKKVDQHLSVWEE